MNTKVSREIKFRAWCEKDQMMYMGIQNGIQFEDGSKYTFDKFLNISSDDYHQWRIMQWTGLKDKTGKEIYEGDLLAEINNTSDLKEWGAPLVVEFGEFLTDKDSWGLEHCTTGFILRYQDGESTGIHSKEGPYGFNSSAMLIVGNIYEHSNLLSQ